MWIFSLLLGSVCISVLTADPAAELQKCMEDANVDELQELAKNPSENELAIVCPMIIGLVDCIENMVVEHLGVGLTDLVKLMPGTDVAKGATLLINVRNVFRELCTNGTDLSKAYEEHAPCFNSLSIEEEDQKLCLKNAVAAYDTYREFVSSVQEHADDSTSESRKECMLKAYGSACIAAKIHEHCGRSAFDFYQRLIKQTTVFRTAICSEEDLMELKTKFADSLDLDSERKDIFRLAFDLKKRRK